MVLQNIVAKARTNLNWYSYEEDIILLLRGKVHIENGSTAGLVSQIVSHVMVFESVHDFSTFNIPKINRRIPPSSHLNTND